MPAVQAMLRRSSIGIIAFGFQHVSDVGGRIQRRKIIVGSEVVFCAGAYNGRKLGVAIQVKLYFTFTKPARG